MPSSLETKHYRRDLNYDSMIKGQIRERRKIEDLKNVSKKDKSLPIVFFGRYLFRVLFKFNFNGIFERYCSWVNGRRKVNRCSSAAPREKVSRGKSQLEIGSGG